MIRIVSPARFILFIFIILIIGTSVLFAVSWGDTTLQRNGELIVAEGEGAETIWGKFVNEGYTSSALPWRFYAWRTEAVTRLQAGSYQLKKGEHVRDVLQRLIAGDTLPDELTLTFPEGFTIQQMATRVDARSISTADEFVQAACCPSQFADQYPYLAELPPDRTLEGYLFPDTYRVFEDDKPADVIQRLLANFDNKLSKELRQKAEDHGRTLDEVVIMASIIEREVISDEDMAMVSGVLWKRFDEGLGLDADATVRFALDKWEEPLTVQDLAIDSPYNTRRYRGLPPGPISNPGLRALTATVEPAESEYYYYLSTPEGETVFSKTNEEHNANKAKYLR